MGFLQKYISMYFPMMSHAMQSKMWSFDVDSSGMDNFRPLIVGCKLVLAFQKIKISI